MGANGWDIPVETIEYRYPWRVLAYGLREDSAGAVVAGRGRKPPRAHPPTATTRSSRLMATARHAAFGLFGGKPGATAHCQIRHRDGTEEEVAPRTMKAERLAVREGDMLVMEATSGAGYGNPLDRAELVVRVMWWTPSSLRAGPHGSTESSSSPNRGTERGGDERAPHRAGPRLRRDRTRRGGRSTEGRVGAARTG